MVDSKYKSTYTPIKNDDPLVNWIQIKFSRNITEDYLSFLFKKICTLCHHKGRRVGVKFLRRNIDTNTDISVYFTLLYCQ